MSSIHPREEVKPPAERSRPQLLGGISPCSSLDCPMTGSGLGPHQDLSAMGHLEEYWEAISADEQVAGREGTSAG